MRAQPRWSSTNESGPLCSYLLSQFSLIRPERTADQTVLPGSYWVDDWLHDFLHQLPSTSQLLQLFPGIFRLLLTASQINFLLENCHGNFGACHGIAGSICLGILGEKLTRWSDWNSVSSFIIYDKCWFFIIYRFRYPRDFWGSFSPLEISNCHLSHAEVSKLANLQRKCDHHFIKIKIIFMLRESTSF